MNGKEIIHFLGDSVDKLIADATIVCDGYRVEAQMHRPDDPIPGSVVKLRRLIREIRKAKAEILTERDT